MQPAEGHRSIEILPTRAAAEEWALVLTALDIVWQLEERLGGWHLKVAAADAERAAAALGAYAAERSNPPVGTPFTEHRGGTITSCAAAILLLLFFAVTWIWWPTLAWTTRGSATAARISAGEWWRVVTALTLHADLPHVLGNSVALALLATAVSRWFGAGVGLWLILVSGAGGNAVNALVRGGAHSAVGASTAVFGAVGILTALQLTRRWRAPPSGLMRMRAWAPLAAGLALLALLGSSETSDVAAHLFGFACGGVLGFLASRLRAERLVGWPQAALAIAAAAAIWGCWWLALEPSRSAFFDALPV